MMRLFYAPGDWVANHTDARFRRASGFWVGALFVVATVGTWVSGGNQRLVKALLLANLLIVCWGIVSTETPVETEE